MVAAVEGQTDVVVNQIPFNIPYSTADDLDYCRAALEDRHLSGDGRFTMRASELLAGIVPGTRPLLTTSCTHALELAAILLDLSPGDEVIVPSFTFASTANAFALRGAVPVFVDIRPDTLNLDESRIEEAVTERTRAIVVVHYGGVAAEMDTVNYIAGRHRLAVVEDNAHGLGGTYKGRPLGSLGQMACQSFHATKNIQCGEGGALLMTDAQLVARAEIIREKGTNRTQFRRGEVDKYTWLDIGSSYLPAELLAAMLAAQLEHFDEIQGMRHRIWGSYHSSLEEWAIAAGVRRPQPPPEAEHAAHLYHLVLPGEGQQQALIEHLGRSGVKAVSHYVPLHNSPAGRALGREGGSCLVAEEVSDRLIRLPLYPTLTDSEVERVTEAVMSFRP
jgi:dTDP-4-amino-4,6-dideoxygalactose transaminase